MCCNEAGEKLDQASRGTIGVGCVEDSIAKSSEGALALGYRTVEEGREVKV